MYWETLLPMSALATIARKIFNGKFTAKIDFPIGYFILPLLIQTLKVKIFSIHYLISIWTTLWWNLNKIVWSEPYKILCFLTKLLTIFDTKCWRHFERHFCDWSNCLMLRYSFKDYHLSLSQKLRNSDTCNQVKNCTKHGRLDQSHKKPTVAFNNIYIFFIMNREKHKFSVCIIWSHFTTINFKIHDHLPI